MNQNEEKDLYEAMSKMAFPIELGTQDGSSHRKLYRHGLVIDYDKANGAAYMIADANFPVMTDGERLRDGNLDITIKFPWSDYDVYDDYYAIVNGIMLMDCSDLNLPHPSSVKAIEFGSVDRNQIVYTYSRGIAGAYSTLTTGRVISIHEDTFDHNCPATDYSSYGAMVINKSKQCVGICCEFDQYLTAYHIPYVRERVDQASERLRSRLRS